MRQRRAHYEQVVQAALPTLTPAQQACLSGLWMAIKACQDAETEEAFRAADQRMTYILDTTPLEDKLPCEVLYDQFPSRLSQEELARLIEIAGL
jgi:hypothetical protein